MSKIKLFDYLSWAEQRKQERGITDSVASIEAMRNKDHERTPEKRAMLASAEKRANEAERQPVTAHF
jgi:hypothetical protein